MEYTSGIVVLIFIFSFFAFIVCIVTEVTKDISFLKKIPTQIQVIFLSEVLTIGSYIGYSNYIGISVTFFYVFASVFCGFFVALVSMQGWNVVVNIYKRVFKK